MKACACSSCQFHVQFWLQPWHHWGYFVNFGATDGITWTVLQSGVPQEEEMVLYAEDLQKSLFYSGFIHVVQFDRSR